MHLHLLLRHVIIVTNPPLSVCCVSCEGRRQPFILFSNRRLIQMADLNGGGQQVVVNNSGMISILNAVDVDFDAR